MTFLLFPLGNPGEKYSNTRHNAARVVLTYLKKEKDFLEFLKDNNIEVYIPECYMNESGKYLKNYIKNKNLDKKNIIVMYDDKDIEIGKVKLSHGRTDGGHNGLKNIIENLGTKDFNRIRVGIAPVGTGREGIIPPHGEEVQKYVLGKISKEEEDVLSSSSVLDRVKIFLEQIVKEVK